MIRVSYFPFFELIEEKYFSAKINPAPWDKFLMFDKTIKHGLSL